MAAGLLNRQQPQGGAPPAQQRGPEPGPQQRQMAEEPGEETNVSPEEQEQYNEFVSNGMNLMYSEQVMPQLLQTIEGDGSPIEGLGNALASLVMRLEDSAEQQGRELSGDVMLHGAGELLEHMVELAEEAGVHEFNEEEMESALYYALDTYRAARQEQGRLDEQGLQQDMQELMGAEQQGRLDEMLPGISEYAERAPRPEDVEQQTQGGGEARPQRRG